MGEKAAYTAIHVYAVLITTPAAALRHRGFSVMEFVVS